MNALIVTHNTVLVVGITDQTDEQVLDLAARAVSRTRTFSGRRVSRDLNDKTRAVVTFG